MKKMIAIIGLMCLCLILSACSTNRDITQTEKVTTENKLKIYTTVLRLKALQNKLVVNMWM